MSKDPGQNVFSFTFAPFLLRIFYSAISSILKGFSLFSLFSLLECPCMSPRVFLFTRTLSSREELFYQFRKRKVSPGVEANLKSWVLGLAGKCLLRFQSLNFSDIIGNLIHNLLEATLTSYFTYLIFFNTNWPWTNFLWLVFQRSHQTCAIQRNPGVTSPGLKLESRYPFKYSL